MNTVDLRELAEAVRANPEPRGPQAKVIDELVADLFDAANDHYCDCRTRESALALATFLWVQAKTEERTTAAYKTIVNGPTL